MQANSEKRYELYLIHLVNGDVIETNFPCDDDYDFPTDYHISEDNEMFEFCDYNNCSTHYVLKKNIVHITFRKFITLSEILEHVKSLEERT